MKRRLLFAASQVYRPRMDVAGRGVGWIGTPITIERGIDQALVGEVAEGVVIAFRGSLAPFSPIGPDGWTVLLDWLNDGLAMGVEDDSYAGRVHLGFAGSMRRLWIGSDGVAEAIRSLIAGGARKHLFVTGHSKGGALANLAAMRIAGAEQWAGMPVSVATIGAARAGDAAFAAGYAASRVACLRYELAHDLVPHLPPGPDTPAWVQDLARSIVPGLASRDYQAVGLRMGAAAHERWTGSRRATPRGLLGRRGIGLVLPMAEMLTAHAICPGSAYDRLVCTGEDRCAHGA